MKDYLIWAGEKIEKLFFGKTKWSESNWMEVMEYITSMPQAEFENLHPNCSIKKYLNER